ncbi:DivIVA domain-containing protein [Floridanema evergladense]|uniref:DivIVA domain-containing protein n=1 Tax=Floridaenema evergladense BLCC-F167 TaxID=3153639 RepID=A0ABV4WGX5_9CYAN
MLHQDTSRTDPDSEEPNTEEQLNQQRTTGVDIQRELNRLEEIILDSPRIPMSRRTLVDEEQLLEQLDLVRLNLPAAFAEAETIVRHKDEIILAAEQYAQQIVEAAEQRANQILEESSVVRQAKLEAQQLWQTVQQECQSAQEQTLAEIESMYREAQEELQDIRAKAIAEAEAIQNGADDYADQVLSNIEQNISEMLRIIRNGRQQLQPPTLPPASSNRSSPIPPKKI